MVVSRAKRFRHAGSSQSRFDSVGKQLVDCNNPLEHGSFSSKSAVTTH
jgi:hypothetical protein